jgi:hypothetical protein
LASFVEVKFMLQSLPAHSPIASTISANFAKLGLAFGRRVCRLGRMKHLNLEVILDHAVFIGVPVVVPCDNKSRALLMHASGGMQGCTQEHYAAEVAPVIEAHGWLVNMRLPQLANP